MVDDNQFLIFLSSLPYNITKRHLRPSGTQCMMKMKIRSLYKIFIQITFILDFYQDLCFKVARYFTKCVFFIINMTQTW